MWLSVRDECMSATVMCVCVLREMTICAFEEGLVEQSKDGGHR